MPSQHQPETHTRTHKTSSNMCYWRCLCRTCRTVKNRCFIVSGCHLSRRDEWYSARYHFPHHSGHKLTRSRPTCHRWLYHLASSEPRLQGIRSPHRGAARCLQPPWTPSLAAGGSPACAPPTFLSRTENQSRTGSSLVKTWSFWRFIYWPLRHIQRKQQAGRELWPLCPLWPFYHFHCFNK